MRKLIIAAVAAASVLETPAMARQSHATSRYLAADAYASVVPYDSYGLFGGYGSYGTHYPRGYSHNPYDSYGARYVGWRGCYPAPRVGAFATAPWTYDMPCAPALNSRHGRDRPWTARLCTVGTHCKSSALF